MKIKINHVTGILLIGLLLSGCGRLAPAKPAVHRQDKTTIKTVRKKTVNPKHVHVPQLRPTTINATPRFADPKNTLGLANVINTAMRGISPGQNGPAQWSVAVASLDGKYHAYLTNWSPGLAQSSASTIKLFILIRYYEELKKGHLQANNPYVLRAADKVEGSGVLLHKKIGSRYSLQQLVTLMIEQSDNIATNVLINKLGGFSGINQTIAKVVGPTHNSSLQRLMMDTANMENGRANRLNAWEAVETLLAMYQGKVLGKTTDQAMLTPMLKTKNRTKLPADLPAGARCYNKSGESNYRGIENDMAIIEYQGHVFAIAALVQLDGDGQPSHNATPAQTKSQVKALARLGANVTTWMAEH